VIWNWAPFFTLLASPHVPTRFAAGCAVSIRLGMSEALRTRFFADTLAVPPLTAVAAPTDSKTAAPTSAPLHPELAALHDSLRAALHSATLFCDPAPAPAPGSELKADAKAPRATATAMELDSASASAASTASGARSLSRSVVDADRQTRAHSVSIGGILIPRKPHSALSAAATAASASASASAGAGSELHDSDDEHHSASASASASSTLIAVPSTAQNLRAMGLALCQGTPVLVEGEAGAGKSALIDECARLTANHDLIRIHLDDQIDSKTLLGTYTCTDVPGQFKSVLASAL
jgi:hypothetical protein